MNDGQSDIFTVTAERLEKLKAIIQNRSRHFTLVLEDFKDPHNISAVVRTSEVFGFQDVHIIEELKPFAVSKGIVKGSFKWLNLFRYKKRANCLKQLRKIGYQIAAASTHSEKSLEELDLERPTAIYMGSEFSGTHPETLDAADTLFKIPQYGLTESLNVSVCAGVILHQLRKWIQKHGPKKYCLSTQEQANLLEELSKRSRFGVEKYSPITVVD